MKSFLCGAAFIEMIDVKIIILLIPCSFFTFHDFHHCIFIFYLLHNRESLFQPVFKNKVTQSPIPGGLRFSTFGYLDNSTPSPPPPPSMHHQQFVASATMPCPTHSQSNVKTHTLPHQHHQHLHSHHHSHRMHSSSSTNQSSHDGNDKSTNTIGRMDEHRALDNDDVHKKFPLKKDDSHSRSYSDVRKSAPDVVIISGCTSSH
jgi:hypothetical protein